MTAYAWRKMKGDKVEEAEGIRRPNMWWCQTHKNLSKCIPRKKANFHHRVLLLIKREIERYHCMKPSHSFPSNHFYFFSLSWLLLSLSKFWLSYFIIHQFCKAQAKLTLVGFCIPCSRAQKGEKNQRPTPMDYHNSSSFQVSEEI